MKTVESFDFGTVGTQAKYDWDGILDGQIHQLTHGVDFPGDPQNFRMMASNVAEKKHKNVRVHISKDTPAVVTIQATPMTDEEVAQADATLAARKERDKARREEKKAAKAAAKAAAPEVPPAA